MKPETYHHDNRIVRDAEKELQMVKDVSTYKAGQSERLKGFLESLDKTIDAAFEKDMFKDPKMTAMFIAGVQHRIKKELKELI